MNNIEDLEKAMNEIVYKDIVGNMLGVGDIIAYAKNIGGIYSKSVMWRGIIKDIKPGHIVCVYLDKNNKFDEDFEDEFRVKSSEDKVLKINSTFSAEQLKTFKDKAVQEKIKEVDKSINYYFMFFAYKNDEDCGIYVFDAFTENKSSVSKKEFESAIEEMKHNVGDGYKFAVMMKDGNFKSLNEYPKFSKVYSTRTHQNMTYFYDNHNYYGYYDTNQFIDLSKKIFSNDPYNIPLSFYTREIFTNIIETLKAE